MSSCGEVDEGDEGIASFTQIINVVFFRVHGIGVVASPDDADPLLGEAADDGVEVFPFLLLIFHVGARPGAVFPAFLGVLVEGLSKEVIAAHSPVDLVGFPALLGNRGHSAEGGESGGVLAEGRIEAEGGQQARGEGFAGAGERGEELGVFGFGEPLGNELVVFFDQAVEGLDLFDDAEQFDFPDRDQVGIIGESAGVVLDREALLEAFGAAGTGGVEKAGEGGLAAAFEGHGIGPLFEEIEVHLPMNVFVQQLEGLRVILLEDRLEAVGEGGALVDELSAGEVEGVEGPGLAVGSLVRAQAAVMPLEELGDAGGVALVGVGARELETLAVVPDDGGIERIDFRVRQGAEEQQQVQRRLFEGDPDKSGAVAAAQVQPPVLQDSWVRGDLCGFENNVPGHQTNGNGTIGTIDAQVKGLGFGWLCRLHQFILSLVFWTRGGDGNRAGFVTVKASSEESFRPCLKTDRGQVSCRSSKDITFHGSRSVVQSTAGAFQGNPRLFPRPWCTRMLALLAPCG